LRLLNPFRATGRWYAKSRRDYENFAALCPPMGFRFGLALPPLPQESPLKRLLLVLDVVDAPSLLLPSSPSSSSMLNRPCSSSILSRLMLLLLTALSRPSLPLELPMLEAEASRFMPGCIGTLGGPPSSEARDDSRVRCSCWLIMLIEACRGGEETNEFASFCGRVMARSEGLAPGCKVELRSGEPTCPNCEPTEPDSKAVSCVGLLPQIDWNREGDDPGFASDAVGEAPSLEKEARCESELPSLSPWSRENRRIFSCGVSRSFSELGSRSSSNFPRFSRSSHSSFMASGGLAPTLEDMMPLDRCAPISECMMRRPEGCSIDSGGAQCRRHAPRVFAKC
jgi:hypothetical protein